MDSDGGKEKEMKYIGIDVGKGGAVAVINGLLMNVYPTPVLNKEYDINRMYGLLKLCIMGDEEVFCVMEMATAMPKQGSVSMFTFGKGYGIWLGLLSALEIKYQIVHPRTWTKHLFEGAPGKDKERGVLLAQRLFPIWQPRLKKDWLLADAILLATYAQRIHSGKNP